MVNIAGIKANIIVKVFKRVVLAYMIYAFVTGVLLFAFHRYSNTTYLQDNPIDRFYSEETGQDRIVLVEDSQYSGMARVNLIESANETLDISYYTIKDGMSANIFLGKILEAADRGVEVRILIDGIFHGLMGNAKDARYALANHPNVELKYYEPFSIIKPWTWNNRLHDKYIIADNTLAMIGGRNIGDRYFLDVEYNGEVVFDRDVVIINTDTDNVENSVIYEMTVYFNYIWEHRISKKHISNRIRFNKRRGMKKADYLREYIDQIEYNNPHLFNNTIDWLQSSVSTKKITFIHNPIGRLNKEPWVWYDIVRLMKESGEQVFIQSPYIIPTRKMSRYIDFDNVDTGRVNILTNSMATSPNYPAVAGYQRQRKNIVDSGVNLYEYHGQGSIHAKSIIANDRISMVGSFNIDARSAFLNTESMVVIDSEEFTRILKGEMNRIIDESLMVDKDYSYVHNPRANERDVSFGKRFIIGCLWIIAYFFDYLL